MSTNNVTTLTPRPDLTASTARQLTDSIRADAESVWKRLLSAYERGAHTALGYSSWAEYCKAEFGMSRARAYQLIDAGRVTKATQSTSVDSPRTEAVARKLTPILKTKGEQAVAEAWVEVVDRHGPRPTATEVEEVVRAMGDEPPPVKKKKLTREQEKFGNNLSAMALCAEYVTATLGGTVPSGATAADRAATKALVDLDEATLALWQSHVRTINAATMRLRRHVELPPKGGAS